MNIDIYTKENCGYCSQAKNALIGRGLKFNEIPFTPELKSALQERVPEGIVVRTVPQIFINNAYIGGYTQLVQYLAANPTI